MQISPFQQNQIPMQFNFPADIPQQPMNGNVPLFFFGQQQSNTARQFTPEEVAMREREREALGQTQLKGGTEEMATPLPSKKFSSAQGLRAMMSPEA